MNLEEASPYTFEFVNIWCYSGKLIQPVNGEDVACSTTQLIDIFIFGEKYIMPGLCNDAIDQLVELYEAKHQFSDRSILKLYDAPVASSTLRKLAVAMMIHFLISSSKLLKDNKERWLRYPEFLSDLAVAGNMERKTPPNPPRLPNPCQYHQHAEGEPKCTRT